MSSSGQSETNVGDATPPNKDATLPNKEGATTPKEGDTTPKEGDTSDSSIDKPAPRAGHPSSSEVPAAQLGGKRRKSRRAGNPWTDLVKRVFNQNKHKSGYKFKHALMDAKQIYKGSADPNRVGTRAAKTVATSIAKTVGRFADKAVGRKTRRRTRGRGRGRGRK